MRKGGQAMPILEVNDLAISFTQYTGGLHQQKLQVVQGVELSVQKGEIVAIVGASGSGKSLLAHAIMGILPENAEMTGTIRYKGELLTAAKQEQLRGNEIALVPQSVNYLDPLMRVGEQVRISARGTDSAERQRKAFAQFKLGAHVERLFPFQLSGGMARRVLVSTATVGRAELIIADEPTPGLNADVVMEALRQFRELADQGCAVLLITHDIESALLIADKVAVFYAGTTVEVATADDFANKGERLRHPYTKALWRALPQNDFVPIPGTQPHARDFPSGCLFAPRCEAATAACSESRPTMRAVRGGLVRCPHAS